MAAWRSAGKDRCSAPPRRPQPLLTSRTFPAVWHARASAIAPTRPRHSARDAGRACRRIVVGFALEGGPSLRGESQRAVLLILLIASLVFALSPESTTDASGNRPHSWTDSARSRARGSIRPGDFSAAMIALWTLIDGSWDRDRWWFLAGSLALLSDATPRPGPMSPLFAWGSAQVTWLHAEPE